MYNFSQIKFLAVLLLFSFTLFSCSKEIRVNSNCIPSSASAVVCVNTEKIFNEAAFDLALGENLGGLSLLPLAGMLNNPSAAGIKMLDKYYFFVSGANLFNVKIGAVIPLSDEDELLDYVQETFKANVIEKSGFKTAKILEKYTVVWDNQTAIFYSGALNEDLIQEAIILLQQKPSEALAAKDSIFVDALNTNAHISTWFYNDQLNNYIDQGSLILKNLNTSSDLPLGKNNRFKSGKTVFFTNFNDGNIAVQQKIYLTKDLLQTERQLEKQNQLTSVMAKASSSNPLLIAKTSINPETITQALKFLDLEEILNMEKINSSLPSQTSLFNDYLEEEIMLVVNGSKEVMKIKQVPDIDDEGNDTLVLKETIEKEPDYILGLLVKDSVKFNFMLNFLSAGLPKYEGFFNYNDELYYTVKDDFFFLTSTKHGVKALNEQKGQLSSKIEPVVYSNNSIFYANAQKILKLNEELSFFGFEGLENISNILAFKKEANSKGVIEGEMIINFIDDKNSLVSVLKILSDLAVLMNPSDSVGIQ